MSQRRSIAPVKQRGPPVPPDGRQHLDAATTLRPETIRQTRLDPAAIETAGVVLCDLDGCLISEGRAFGDAPRFAAACGDRLWIVSNRSDTTAALLSARLAPLGLHVPPARILLAGEVALEQLAHAGVERLRLWADPALQARARTLGLDIDAPRPEAVLLCRDAAVTVETMGPLLAEVASGAALWVANEDLSHPGHDGAPVAETGALLAALRAIRPELGWRSLGKPDPLMLTTALARSGMSAAEAVFVGDNAATDGRAAAAAGIPFLHLQRSVTR